MQLTSHTWTEGSDHWMLASPADGAWAGYCGLRTGQTRWNELQGTGHELVPNTLLERPVLPRKTHFLSVATTQDKNIWLFFLLSLFRTVTLLFWLLRDFTEKLVKIRPPPPLPPQQSDNAIRYINDQVSRATSNKVVPRAFSSHFKGEALGTRLNLKIANNGFFFRHLLWLQ